VSASPFLLTEDVAERLRCSVRTVHEMTRSDAIPYFKRGGGRRCLFRLDQLEQWEQGAALEVVEPGRGGKVVSRLVKRALEARDDQMLAEEFQLYGEEFLRIAEPDDRARLEHEAREWFFTNIDDGVVLETYWAEGEMGTLHVGFSADGIDMWYVPGPSAYARIPIERADDCEMSFPIRTLADLGEALERYRLDLTGSVPPVIARKQDPPMPPLR
jgi:excisionase family DNA binding protein